MATQDGDDQRKRWYSGVQAIFAGFVAASEESTLNGFWESPQMPLVRTTLSSVQPLPPGIPEGRPSEEMEIALKNALLIILRDGTNDLTSPTLQLDGTFEERLQVQWQLTEKGRSRFERGNEGGDGGNLAPGMWWNDDSQTSSASGA